MLAQLYNNNNGASAWHASAITILIQAVNQFFVSFHPQHTNVPHYTSEKKEQEEEKEEKWSNLYSSNSSCSSSIIFVSPFQAHIIIYYPYGNKPLQVACFNANEIYKITRWWYVHVVGSLLPRPIMFPTISPAIFLCCSETKLSSSVVFSTFIWLTGWLNLRVEASASQAGSQYQSYHHNMFIRT